LTPLALHGFHAGSHARFRPWHDREIVADYGHPIREHTCLLAAAGILDLGFRGRLCLTGADRGRFLHGQVTNQVKDLPARAGCYAALVSAKGKLQGDLNIFNLEDEFLLDFEPGLTEAVTQRLQDYIIADDVQVLDVASHYGLLSIQGPRAHTLVQSLLPGPGLTLPAQPHQVTLFHHPDHAGDFYCMNLPRTTAPGYDLYVPTPALETLARHLAAAAGPLEGGLCGWDALETRRIESGLPRFGMDGDMDASNLAPETGIDDRAISYAKGCYIGQEIIARIRTYGQVTKKLRGFKLAPALATLPGKGSKLFVNDQEAGYLTTATRSPALNAPIALGYVRRQHDLTGAVLSLHTPDGKVSAEIVDLPFVR
jgi:folate-binding protein YgfZ